MKQKILIILSVVAAIDLVVLNFFVFSKKDEVKSEEKVVETVINNLDSGDLGKRITMLENDVLTLKTATKSSVIEDKPVPIATIVESKKTKYINYLPINGSLSQIAYDWVGVPASQFYFDKSDYVGLKEVRLEANMKLLNGNGLAFVRLFDVTHGVAVTKSQIQTASQKDTVIVSEPMNFMEGRNLIEVQIKSLTADSAVFSSGRLVIRSEY